MAQGLDNEELDKRFTYQPPKAGQPERYVALRDLARQFATAVVDLSPASREQSLALSRIEEAVMWANAAIARRE